MLLQEGRRMYVVAGVGSKLMFKQSVNVQEQLVHVRLTRGCPTRTCAMCWRALYNRKPSAGSLRKSLRKQIFLLLILL